MGNFNDVCLRGVSWGRAGRKLLHKSGAVFVAFVFAGRGATYVPGPQKKRSTLITLHVANSGSALSACARARGRQRRAPYLGTAVEGAATNGHDAKYFPGTR